MKKNYVIPALSTYQVEPIQVIADSFIIGGDAGVDENGDAEEVKDAIWMD